MRSLALLYAFVLACGADPDAPGPDAAPADAAAPDAASPADAGPLCFIDAAPDAAAIPCAYGTFPCPFGMACNDDRICLTVCE